MTSIRRTSWTPLGRPVAGDMIRGEEGTIVPIRLGPGEDLHVSDATWARELVAAASVAASVLESEDGLPTPTEPTAADPLAEERDAYRDVLSRLVGAERPSDLWPAIRDARLALDRWAGRP
ncbi:hypothetical protein AB0F17_58605 [Nonomuraea sp. NPDC026600]|uniref:hypothetical protein n=1 Tax=Nonomuraea sp. NPDC026600 TaxID=3155363 RepID=UPI0033E3AD3D